MRKRTARLSNALQKQSPRQGFTLIELLVVIGIIAILVGMLFPAFKAVQNQARNTQAKNDLTQIVTAVNAFYTDYGKYPIPGAADVTYGPGGNPTSNETLFRELRGCTGVTGDCVAAATLNTRQIAFISPPDAKDPTNPRSGIGTAANIGRYFDPWGNNYIVSIDGGYNNQLTNPYTADTGAGAGTLSQGVIAWSAGPDNKSPGNNGGTTTFSASDDVISWQ